MNPIYYNGDLYVGITMDVKKISYYLQDLETGITMDIKTNNYL